MCKKLTTQKRFLIQGSALIPEIYFAKIIKLHFCEVERYKALQISAVDSADRAGRQLRI